MRLSFLLVILLYVSLRSASCASDPLFAQPDGPAAPPARGLVEAELEALSGPQGATPEIATGLDEGSPERMVDEALRVQKNAAMAHNSAIRAHARAKALIAFANECEPYMDALEQFEAGPSNDGTVLLDEDELVAQYAKTLRGTACALFTQAEVKRLDAVRRAAGRR